MLSWFGALLCYMDWWWSWHGIFSW